MGMFLRYWEKLGVVACAFNPGYLGDWAQDFGISLENIVRPIS
jgi:hypothetical protein